MLSDAKPVSPETEKVIDESMANLEEGKAGPPIDPAAQAAHNLPAMLGWFRNTVEEKLTGTQAKKVLVALAEVPFAEKPPVFTTQEAYDLFNLGQQIFNAKFLILMASLRDASKAKKEESSKTEEVKVEENTNDQKV